MLVLCYYYFKVARDFMQQLDMFIILNTVQPMLDTKLRTVGVPSNGREHDTKYKYLVIVALL